MKDSDKKSFPEWFWYIPLTISGISLIISIIR